MFGLLKKIFNSGNTSNTNNQINRQIERTMSYHKQFNVAGVTFKCGLDSDFSRQEIIEGIRKKDTFRLEEYKYKGSPAFYVVNNRNNLDIGCVPAVLVDSFLKYKDHSTEVRIVDIDEFEKGRKTISSVKAQFIVWKD